MRKCPCTCIYFTQHGTYEVGYYYRLSNSCGFFWGMNMPCLETVIIPAYKDTYVILWLYFLKSLDRSFG